MGIVIFNTQEGMTELIERIIFKETNNMEEYEVVILTLK